MLLRLVVIFAALCALSGLLLAVAAAEAEWALWLGGAGALVLALCGIHRSNTDEAKLPKWARRPVNFHGD
jgi:hypothetical protein